MQNSESHVLQDALDNLPHEIKPDRDLWKGIELAIESENQGAKAVENNNHIAWYATAASVALAAVVTWQSVISPNGDIEAQSAALVASLSSQHQTNLQALKVKFDGQPAVTENWQQQLEELDSAAEAIKTALEHDPANPALLKMLQHTYQQQIALIERVHAPKWQKI